MIRALLCLVPLTLSACAGTASYSVRPFYEPNLKQIVCCEAVASNSKDIASLSFDLSTAQNGVVTVHFAETGVGATAPLNAQSQATAAIAGAVSNAAAAVIKVAP